MADTILMQEKDWQSVKHLKKDDPNWGDWSKVSRELIWTMDACFHYCLSVFPTARFYLHCAYDLNGHATNSQHYLGNALDANFVNVKLVDQLLLLERFQFGGIGLYPYWNNKGFHADVREVGAMLPENRWLQDDKKVYVALNWDNIVKHIYNRGV
jgi:hypothetical protein